MLTAAVIVGAIAVVSGTMQTPRDRPAIPDPTEAPLWHAALHVRGSPLAHGDRVYALGRAHEVVAFAAADGAEQWRQRTGQPGDTTSGSRVVAARDLVIAGDGTLVAFDAAGGELRWRFAPEDDDQPGLHLGDAAGNLVFTGSLLGRLRAIDVRTGHEHWSVSVSADGHSTVYAPVSAGPVVVAGYTSFTTPAVGGLVAVDAETGRERWRARFMPAVGAATDAGFAGGPLVWDHLVVASAGDGRIHAFDRHTGTLQWTLPAITGSSADIIGDGTRDYRPLAVQGDVLMAGSLTGHVTAFDLRSREVLWRYAGGHDGSTALSIGVDDAVVYVPYVSGFLVGLDVRSGAERFRAGTWRDLFLWPPAVGHEAFFLGGARAGVFALQRVGKEGA